MISRPATAARNGTQFHVGFTFEGATLDGSPVKASVEPFGNGVRIKLGDPDTYVDVGEHEYVIRYRATREIGRFANFDELYWNVTGNGWIFPIDEAPGPDPPPLAGRASATAPSTPARKARPTHNAAVVDEKPGDITFRTTPAARRL